MNNKEIWLVGAGEMGLEYAKVLDALNLNFKVIGRSLDKKRLFEKFNCEFVSGGIEKHIKSCEIVPCKVIVAVGIEVLKDVAISLINFGVKNIMLEKPGVAYLQEIDELYYHAEKKNINLLIAYNRRFYASVIKAIEIIEKDGGLSSFNFEFTEWSHLIKDLDKHPAEHQNWFLGNSTHVIDTAFYVAGEIDKISTFYNNSDQLSWHKKATNFSGAGITKSKALFSYCANWQAPGRWSIEFLTKKHRLVLRPMEKLQIQEIGSVKINYFEGIDYSLDEKFKPGLYLQTKSFLENKFEDFCTINKQRINVIDIYSKISGY